MPEMGKRCGEMWRELSEEEEKPYHVSPYNTLLRPSQPSCFYACMCGTPPRRLPRARLARLSALNLPAHKSVRPGKARITWPAQQQSSMLYVTQPSKALS
jgi:hypothetical protein